MACSSVPTLKEDEIFTMTSAGIFHNVGLTSAGRIMGWGRNDDGQCSRVPTLQEDEVFIMASAGSNHSVGLTSAVRIVRWGRNKEGYYILVILRSVAILAQVIHHEALPV